MKKCHICILSILVIGILACCFYPVYTNLIRPDVDECSSSINPCGVNAHCINLPSGYSCLCPVGFAAKNTTNPECKKIQDLDEVEINPTSNAVSVNSLSVVGVQCLSDQTCTNNTICIAGTCRCPEGFHEKDGLCIDIDECINYACGPHAVCTNLPAGYHCICKIGSTGNPPQTPCEVAACPKPYFQAGSQCFYKPKVVSKSWDSAQRWCKGQGSFLAEPKFIDNFRNALISSGSRYTVSSRFYGYWLGASDRAEPGVWKWSSSGLMIGNSDSWYPGEPNNNEGKEGCLFLVKDRKQPLDDRDCSESYPFLCEKVFSNWTGIEYEDQNLLVTPEIFCNSNTDCIEGLDCKKNFCHCPEGCVYIRKFASCDCGDYYDSDEYWELSYVWPSIVGTAAGLLITCFWCICICETNSRFTPDDDEGGLGEEQSLTPLPTEINQTENNLQSLLNEPVDVPVVEFSSGTPFNPDQDAASAPPYPVNNPSTSDGLSYNSSPVPGAALPYSLDPCSKAGGPSTFTASSYPPNPPPFAPQLYGVNPYDSQPPAVTSVTNPFDLPPPSYTDATADQGHLGKEEDTSSVTLK